MSKRIGTVLVFNEDVTPEEAEAALNKIQDMLEQCWLTDDWLKSKGYMKGTPAKHFPKQTGFRLEKFDDEHGMPVFYVP